MSCKPIYHLVNNLSTAIQLNNIMLVASYLCDHIVLNIRNSSVKDCVYVGKENFSKAFREIKAITTTLSCQAPSVWEVSDDFNLKVVIPCPDVENDATDTIVHYRTNGATIHKINIDGAMLERQEIPHLFI